MSNRIENQGFYNPNIQFGKIISRRAFLLGISSVMLGACFPTSERNHSNSDNEYGNKSGGLITADNFLRQRFGDNGRVTVTSRDDGNYEVLGFENTHDSDINFDNWLIVYEDIASVNDDKLRQILTKLGLHDEYVPSVSAAGVFSFLGINALLAEMMKRAYGNDLEDMRDVAEYFSDHVSSRAREEKACGLPNGHNKELALLIALSALGKMGREYALKGVRLERIALVNPFRNFFSMWHVFSVSAKSLRGYLQRHYKLSLEDVGLDAFISKIHNNEERIYLRMMHGIGYLDESKQVVSSFTGSTSHLISPENLLDILAVMNDADLKSLAALNNDEDRFKKLRSSGQNYLRRFLEEIFRRYRSAKNICKSLGNSLKEDKKDKERNEKGFKILNPDEVQDILSIEGVLRMQGESFIIDLGDFQILIKGTIK